MPKNFTDVIDDPVKLTVGVGTTLYIADHTSVEDAITISSIIDSISNCKTAIGSYSTALTQAYCSGKNVVLDDMTYQHQYEKLKDLRYWLINEGCARLSSMQ